MLREAQIEQRAGPPGDAGRGALLIGGAVRMVPFRGRQPALDGLRALAAISVLCFHVANTTVPQGRGVGLPDALRLAVISLGPDGVTCFFVLSAFLLTQPFLRWVVASESRPRLSSYVQGRVLRIFPAWWVVLAVMAVWYAPSILSRPRDLISFVVLGQNYLRLGHHVVPHGWTLVVEISFYLLMPLAAGVAFVVVRPFGSRARAVVVAVALLVLTVVSWGVELHRLKLVPTHGGWRLALPMYLDRFTIGTLAALIAVVAGHRLRWAAWPLLALAAVLLVLSFTEFPVQRYQVAALAFGLVVLGLTVSSASLPHRALAHPWLVGLGVISYGIYLWHLPVKYLAQRAGWLDVGHGIETLPAILLVFAATLLCATASYHLVERPALSLRGRLRLPLPSKTRPVAPPRAVNSAAPRDGI